MNARASSQTGPMQYASVGSETGRPSLVVSKFKGRNQAIDGLARDLENLRAGERGHVSLFLITVDQGIQTRRGGNTLPLSIKTITNSLLEIAPFGRVRTTKSNQLMLAIISGSEPRSIQAAAENLHGSIQLELAHQHLFPNLAIGASSTAIAGVCAKTLLMQASQATANALRDRTHISVFDAHQYQDKTSNWLRPPVCSPPRLRIVR